MKNRGLLLDIALSDLERISDHCRNIAVDIIESGPNGVEAHEYHMTHDYRNDPVFTQYTDEYKVKYAL